MKKSPNDSLKSNHSNKNTSSKKQSPALSSSPLKNFRYSSPPERLSTNKKTNEKQSIIKKSSEMPRSKLKTSSNYSTPLKLVNKESMNFEINYIDQVDIHEIESNKIFTPLLSEHKELNSEKKEALIYKAESPNLAEEGQEETMQTRKIKSQNEKEVQNQENEKREIVNIKGDKKLNFNPTFEPTSTEPNRNMFNGGPDPKKSNFFYQKHDEQHESNNSQSYNPNFPKNPTLNLSDEIKKTELIEAPSLRNESFHASHEQDPHKPYNNQLNQGDYFQRPDNLKDFNPKNSNIPNFPGFDMGYMMYIVNFYEFHLSNMQNIIMQKNEEIMNSSMKIKDLNDGLNIMHNKYKELYLKNEYENDTFDKKYNALLDEMHILKQRDRMLSSKVNFYNENEDSFHNEKNLLKDLENYKITIADLKTSKDFLEKRINEFEIILINKEESFKDIQKTNDFLMTDLSYHKKAYMNLEKINSDLWNDINKMREEQKDLVSSRKRWGDDDNRLNINNNDSNSFIPESAYTKKNLNEINYETLVDNKEIYHFQEKKPQENYENHANKQKEYKNFKQKNNSSVMKNLLIWEGSEINNELSPKKRGKSPLMDEQTSPFLSENNNRNPRNIKK